MHVILKSLIILAFAIGLVSAERDTSCWFPCPRILDPISVYDKGKCVTHANPCTLKNAIRCGEVSADAFCRRGNCGNTEGDEGNCELHICHNWDPDA